MMTLDLRARFGLTALGFLALYCAIGWFCSGILADFTRPLAEMALRATGIATHLERADDGGWRIWTPYAIATGSPDMLGKAAGLVLGVDELRTLLRGAPIYLALMSASAILDRPNFARLALGVAVLTALFVVSCWAVANFQFAVLADHRANPLVSRATPPDFTIRAPAYGEFRFALSGYANYLAMMVAPLAAPLVLWAAQSREAVQRLLAGADVKALRSRIPG